MYSKDLCSQYHLDCASCISHYCVWIRSPDFPDSRCLILQEVTMRYTRLVSSRTAESCPPQATTGSPIYTHLVEKQEVNDERITSLHTGLWLLAALFLTYLAAQLIQRLFCQKGKSPCKRLRGNARSVPVPMATRTEPVSGIRMSSLGDLDGVGGVEEAAIAGNNGTGGSVAAPSSNNPFVGQVLNPFLLAALEEQEDEPAIRDNLVGLEMELVRGERGRMEAGNEEGNGLRQRSVSRDREVVVTIPGSFDV